MCYLQTNIFREVPMYYEKKAMTTLKGDTDLKNTNK